MSNTISYMKTVSKLVMKANMESGARRCGKKGNSVTLVRQKIV